jgi:hypothetical protein
MNWTRRSYGYIDWDRIDRERRAAAAAEYRRKLARGTMKPLPRWAR